MVQSHRFSILTLALVTLFAFAAPPLNAGIVAYGAPEIQAQAGTPVHAYLAYFTTSRTSTKAQEISVTVDWGDGTASAGACVLDRNGRFWVYGDHSYSTDGIYKVNVKIFDPILGYGTSELHPGVQ